MCQTHLKNCVVLKTPKTNTVGNKHRRISSNGVNSHVRLLSPWEFMAVIWGFEHVMLDEMDMMVVMCLFPLVLLFVCYTVVVIDCWGGHTWSVSMH